MKLSANNFTFVLFHKAQLTTLYLHFIRLNKTVCRQASICLNIGAILCAVFTSSNLFVSIGSFNKVMLTTIPKKASSAPQHVLSSADFKKDYDLRKVNTTIFLFKVSFSAIGTICSFNTALTVVVIKWPCMVFNDSGKPSFAMPGPKPISTATIIGHT
jgi:hypothetical protein